MASWSDLCCAAAATLQAERSAAVGTAVSLEVKLADARREADRERAAVIDLRAALSAAEVRFERIPKH